MDEAAVAPAETLEELADDLRAMLDERRELRDFARSWDGEMEEALARLTSVFGEVEEIEDEGDAPELEAEAFTVLCRVARSHAEEAERHQASLRSLEEELTAARALRRKRIVKLCVAALILLPILWMILT